MAENTDEGTVDQLAASGVTAQIEAAQKTAAKVADEIERQHQSITALSRFVDEVRTRVDTLVQAASVNAAVSDRLRTEAEVRLKQIEEDARKANSEAGFAFNAKAVAEEHAKSIAQIQGTVQATFSGLTATKTSTDELLQAIAAARAASEADAKAISDAKADAVRDAAQVTAAKERIAAVMPAIDQGAKDANSITAAKSGAEAGAAEIRTFQSLMSEITAKATTDGAAVAKADDDCKALVSSMTDARNKANEANARLRAYESEIESLKKAFSEMQSKLEGLLPHATSAGLASAFHIQKARFSKPQPYWLGVFLVAILGLLVAAGYGLPTTLDTWDAILRHFVNRLPIVAPLVWLAIYAGHHYSVALRMEEDYAFKEAVSTAFEGYKREMQSIPTSPGNDVSPLVTLCENVLSSLAERPGRIYDGKTDVVTPLTPALSSLNTLMTELLKRKEQKP